MLLSCRFKDEIPRVWRENGSRNRSRLSFKPAESGLLETINGVPASDEQTVKQFDQITVAGTGFKRSRELQKEKRQHSGVVLINSVPISIG